MTMKTGTTWYDLGHIDSEVRGTGSTDPVDPSKLDATQFSKATKTLAM